MLVVCPKLTEKQLRKIAKDVVKMSTVFFRDNPKRRVCRVEVWYGKVITVKKNDIAGSVETAVTAAIKKNWTITPVF